MSVGDDGKEKSCAENQGRVRAGSPHMVRPGFLVSAMICLGKGGLLWRIRRTVGSRHLPGSVISPNVTRTANPATQFSPYSDLPWAMAQVRPAGRRSPRWHRQLRAHALRNVCASLLIASGSTDMQVASP